MRTWGYYAAVVHGSFNRETGHFVFQYDENHATMVDGKKVANTIQRLKDGHDWITADPVHVMDREEAGYLLANADELLKEISKAHV